jgi:hypothetical protein
VGQCAALYCPRLHRRNPASRAANQQSERNSPDIAISWPEFWQCSRCRTFRALSCSDPYLSAVYGLVSWWAAEERAIDRVRRALRLQRLEVSEREDPFAAVIWCTADPAKADKRTRSKWSRVMRYAAVYKPDSEPLDKFVRRKGGINACAARFSRCLGRGPH